jgi:hypothetical protein
VWRASPPDSSRINQHEPQRLPRPPGQINRTRATLSREIKQPHLRARRRKVINEYKQA